jgi:hypothetical protein
VTGAPLAPTLLPPFFTPTFSGHETFVLRSTWLKKAYDLLQDMPNLFANEDAFVMLGVGKNMAQSIRFWGRACGVFASGGAGAGQAATPLGDALLADDGWDPFLVTPASWWLLHWQIAARPTAAFTWFYTFNLLRGGEFSAVGLASQLQTLTRERNWREPSDATIGRDIETMLHCYLRPSAKNNVMIAEDALLCPLSELGLIQAVPGERLYHLVSGPQPTLPTALVVYALHQMLEPVQRRTISFNELAYAPGSPGRVFRLDEDELLMRLQQLETETNGAVRYTDQAGIRQVAWDEDLGPEVALRLLQRAFPTEVLHD